MWLLLALIAGASADCVRSPDERIAAKSPGDGGFQIQIDNGRTQTYVPNQSYVVSVSGNGGRPFRRFSAFQLAAEHSYNSRMRDGDHPRSGGPFILYSDQNTIYQDMCVNTVREGHNFRSRTGVQVMWVAPSHGGCVTIKATVIVNANTWYADEGRLTLQVCDSAHREAQPTDEECCACSSAKYKMVFEGLWSKETHPKDFPTNVWATHFSDIIGASHRRNFSFWGEGQLATEGLRQLAEWGTTRGIEPELKNQARYLRTLFRAEGLWYPDVNKNTTATFRVDKARPLVSLVSMFGPSPDWIVGLSNLSLCTSNCDWVESKVIDLFPYDAGTDNGVTYMSMKDATTPQERIHRITTHYPEDPRGPFYKMEGGDIPPLARIYLQREAVQTQSCASEDRAIELPQPQAANELTEDVRRPECNVTEYSAFGPCSVSCGKGIRMRTRQYVMEKKAMMARCQRQLVNKEMCIAEQPLCPGDQVRHPNGLIQDPVDTSEEAVEDTSGICQTSEFSQWSECSVTCGIGQSIRSRTFYNMRGRKVCPHIRLHERKACMTTKCPEHSPGISMDDRCKVSEWGDFSPCSATCGTGLRYRSRQLLVTGELKDICQGRVELKQQMVCTILADCNAPNIRSTAQRDTCLMSAEAGPCRGFYNRWYFEPFAGRCVSFSYGGCRGNKNNFLTEEECMTSCGSVAEELKEARKEQPLGSVTNCQVSDWSRWSACSATCGSALRVQTRSILIQPTGGGTPCPNDRELTKFEPCQLSPCPA